jgi:hypothetical protein
MGDRRILACGKYENLEMVRKLGDLRTRRRLEGLDDKQQGGY